MKVGDILKGDVKNIKGLKYPFKIIISEKCKYPKEKIIENEIYLGNCNTFLNDFHYNKDEQRQRQRSFSYKRNMPDLIGHEDNNKIPISFYKKLFLQTNINKLENSLNKNDNLPLLVETMSTPKKKPKIKLITSYKKISSSLINENSLIKNKIKIKTLKSINNESNNQTNLTVSGRKKGMTPIYKSRKFNVSLKVDNLLNSKNKKYIKQKIPMLPNILESRLQKKIKNINHIIDKLNTPIFINSKIDIN